MKEHNNINEPKRWRAGNKPSSSVSPSSRRSRPVSCADGLPMTKRRRFARPAQRNAAGAEAGPVCVRRHTRGSLVLLASTGSLSECRNDQHGGNAAEEAQFGGRQRRAVHASSSARGRSGGVCGGWVSVCVRSAKHAALGQRRHNRDRSSHKYTRASESRVLAERRTVPWEVPVHSCTPRQFFSKANAAIMGRAVSVT